MVSKIIIANLATTSTWQCRSHLLHLNQGCNLTKLFARHKAPTTADPSHGIADAILTMFKSASVAPKSVASVTIGTTHFVNAVVTRDSTRLSPVAVLRLSGPFSKHAPPCVDWPASLRKIILAHYALVKGGLEIDGDLISDIDEQEIVEQCRVIKEKGIKSIVVK